MKNEAALFRDVEPPRVDWFDVAIDPSQLAGALESINLALAELRRENLELKSCVEKLESYHRPGPGDWVVD